MCKALLMTTILQKFIDATMRVHEPQVAFLLVGVSWVACCSVGSGSPSPLHSHAIMADQLPLESYPCSCHFEGRKPPFVNFQGSTLSRKIYIILRGFLKNLKR
jgi:hypothetical protein